MAWMNLENTVRSERIQTQKATHHTIPFTITVQNRQTPRDRKSISGCQELEGRGKVLNNGFEVSLGDDGNVPELDSRESCPTLWIYLKITEFHGLWSISAPRPRKKKKGMRKFCLARGWSLRYCVKQSTEPCGLHGTIIITILLSLLYGTMCELKRGKV